MKFVGWKLYNMKFVCYIAGAISKDMRWFIVAALFAIAHELRHIWNRKENSNES